MLQKNQQPRPLGLDINVNTGIGDLSKDLRNFGISFLGGLAVGWALYFLVSKTRQMRQGY
jgi:hypothetical protein